MTLEGTENLQSTAPLASASDAEAGAPTERAPRARGERRERGERNGEARDRFPADAPARDSNGDGPQADGPSSERNDRPAREEREPRGERSERNGDGRRERRTNDGAARTAEPMPAAPESNAEGGARIDEGAPAESGARREGDERRGRSRDRYGRDRRERAPREGDTASEGSVAGAPETGMIAELPASAPVGMASEAAVASEAPASVPSATASPVAEVPHSAPEAAESVSTRRAERVPRPAAVSTPSEGQAANGRRALPKVQTFELPLADLAQVAEGSGLQWVNSDAERVAQVRAAIAAEAKPIHVPRERPAVAVAEDGPLILVETRRDLAKTVLPFEGKQDNAAH